MRALAPIVAIALGAVLTAGCSDDSSDAGDARADQVRDAARDADLPEAIEDLLAQLAGSADERFQVVYPNETGDGQIVVSQDPPELRVDISRGDELVESKIVTGGTRYTCAPGTDDALTCERAGGDTSLVGLFDPEALADAVEAVAASTDDYVLTIEDRTILDVAARCLVTTRREAAPPDDEAGDLGELCVSPEGAVLRVVSGGQSVEATGYTTEIPDGTFELPNGDDG